MLARVERGSRRMRAWLLEADCPCGAEIPGVEQFSNDTFCCIACRRELILLHDCYDEDDCCDFTIETKDFESHRGFPL